MDHVHHVKEQIKFTILNTLYTAGLMDEGYNPSHDAYEYMVPGFTYKKLTFDQPIPYKAAKIPSPTLYRVRVDGFDNKCYVAHGVSELAWIIGRAIRRASVYLEIENAKTGKRTNRFLNQTRS
jgi:hypothetical protein